MVAVASALAVTCYKGLVSVRTAAVKDFERSLMLLPVRDLRHMRVTPPTWMPISVVLPVVDINELAANRHERLCLIIRGWVNHSAWVFPKECG